MSIRKICFLYRKQRGGGRKVITNRERIIGVLNNRRLDRLPVIEWATWWDQTINTWEKQGMPSHMDTSEIMSFHGLDVLQQLWIPPRTAACPGPKKHGAAIVNNMESYEAIKPYLFKEEIIEEMCKRAETLRGGHERGEYAIWITLEGFFWFPRTLLGIEEHLFAFYDEPELIKKMNEDLTVFYLKVLKKLFKIVKPEFMTFAEDMSYNHGPMLSKDCFDGFLAPYYRKIVPYLKENGVKVLVDTDGDVTQVIPWLLEVDVEGVLPLERQAGVDLLKIRQQYPQLKMIGGYDKTIMHLGKEAMIKEFERILPVMKSGGYIPSVDHQTPPDVTLENYKTYVALLKEYAKKCMK